MTFQLQALHLGKWTLGSSAASQRNKVTSKQLSNDRSDTDTSVKLAKELSKPFASLTEVNVGLEPCDQGRSRRHCNSSLQGLARVGKVEVRIRTGFITRRSEHEREAAAKIPREETRNQNPQSNEPPEVLRS